MACAVHSSCQYVAASAVRCFKSSVSSWSSLSRCYSSENVAMTINKVEQLFQAAFSPCHVPPQQSIANTISTTSTSRAVFSLLCTTAIVDHHSYTLSHYAKPGEVSRHLHLVKWPWHLDTQAPKGRSLPHLTHLTWTLCCG